MLDPLGLVIRAITVQMVQHLEFSLAHLEDIMLSKDRLIQLPVPLELTKNRTKHSNATLV